MLVQPGSQSAKALRSPKFFPESMAGGRNGFCVDITTADCAGLEPGGPLHSITTRQQGNTVRNGCLMLCAIRSLPAQDHPGLLVSAAGGGRTGPERLSTVSAVATAVMARSARTTAGCSPGALLTCMNRVGKQVCWPRVTPACTESTSKTLGTSQAWQEPRCPHGWCVCPACTAIPACLVPGTCSVLARGYGTEHKRAVRGPELKEDTSPGVAGGAQAARGGPWSVCCCAREPAGHQNTRAARWCCRRSSFFAIRSWLFPGLAQAIV